MSGQHKCLAIVLLLTINHLSSIESAFDSGDVGRKHSRATGKNHIQTAAEGAKHTRIRKTRQYDQPYTITPHHHNIEHNSRRKLNTNRNHQGSMLSSSKAAAVQQARDDGSFVASRANKNQKLTNGERKSKVPNTLQLVTVMFRHGDRAPEPAEISNFPNYEYANETWYPVGAGHLTNNGKLRLYKLGKTLRARYGKFLGDLYSTEVAVTYCTDFPRTKASAQMFHAGLWPPNKDQIWSEDETLASLWQPIPYSIDPKLNSAMNSFLRSPCFAYEYSRVLQLPEFQQLMFPHEKLLNLLMEKTGMKIDNPLHVWLVRSLFLAQEAMGKMKPDWATENWEEISLVSDIAFSALLYNNDLKRMAIGPILKKILNDCQDKADGVLEPRQRKLIVYSGHDTTVGPLLAAMGGEEGYIDEDGNPLKTIVPSFGSSVILELHKIDGEYAIKILFNEKSPDGKFKPLRLVGYGEYCPLDKYIELTKNIAMDDQGLDKCPDAKHSTSLFDKAVKRKQ